jgi:hypothetical protein
MRPVSDNLAYLIVNSDEKSSQIDRSVARTRAHLHEALLFLLAKQRFVPATNPSAAASRTEVARLLRQWAPLT